MSKKVECGSGCDPNAPTSLPRPHNPQIFTGVDCGGGPVTASGPGVVQTIPHPEAVQNVRICNPTNEFQTVFMCLPNGDRVIAVITLNPVTGVPVTNYYNLDGTPFTGDPDTLTFCGGGGGGGGGPELVPQPMCDGGFTNFLRWFVSSESGEVLGSFDTNLVGLPYTPTGSVTLGVCGTADPFVVPVHWIENISTSPVCVEGRAVYGYNSSTGGFSMNGLYSMMGLPILSWPDTLMDGPCPGLPFYVEVVHWEAEVGGCQEGLALYVVNPISQTGEVVYMGLFHRIHSSRIEPEPPEFFYGPCPNGGGGGATPVPIHLEMNRVTGASADTSVPGGSAVSISVTFFAAGFMELTPGTGMMAVPSGFTWEAEGNPIATPVTFRGTDYIVTRATE